MPSAEIRIWKLVVLTARMEMGRSLYLVSMKTSVDISGIEDMHVVNFVLNRTDIRSLLGAVFRSEATESHLVIKRPVISVICRVHIIPKQ